MREGNRVRAELDGGSPEESRQFPPTALGGGGSKVKENKLLPKVRLCLHARGCGADSKKFAMIHL